MMRHHQIIQSSVSLSDTSFHAINAIVDEAADATADRVAVNAATIVNEVALRGDEAEGLVGA